MGKARVENRIAAEREEKSYKLDERRYIIKKEWDFYFAEAMTPGPAQSLRTKERCFCVLN